MTTIFRFAIQTKGMRHSEIWSFSCNKKQGCLYATRTSMRQWLKISFHKSRSCHIKTYDDDSRPFGVKAYDWKSPEIVDDNSAHILRIIYDFSRQGGNFEFDGRVNFLLEELYDVGSLYLDAFITSSDIDIEVNTNKNIVASHHMGGRNWVYFTIHVGPPQNLPPGPLSGMTFHMGEYNQSEGIEVPNLRNATAIWYAVPHQTGTLIIAEASWANFLLGP